MPIGQVWIDEENCMGHAMCVKECPEVFQILPGATTASVKPNADFQTHDRNIRSAIECCPMDCIHIHEVKIGQWVRRTADPQAPTIGGFKRAEHVAGFA